MTSAIDPTVLADPAAGPDDVIAALAGTSEPSRGRLWAALELVDRRIAAHSSILDRPDYSATEIALLYSLAPPRSIGDAWRGGRFTEKLLPIAAEAAAHRDESWRSTFADLAYDERGMVRSLFTVGVVAELRRRGLVTPTRAEHFVACIISAYPPGVIHYTVHGDVRSPAEYERDRLLLRDHELWVALETEGVGWWDRDVDQLIAALDIDASYRARLLDATLHSLVRDFSAHNIRLPLALHRGLEPTLDEVRERESLYVRVLLAQPSTAVGLAQEHLARLVDGGTGGDRGTSDAFVDLSTLLHASEVVLARREKKCVLSQLRLLERLARQQPDSADRAAAVIATVLDDDRRDLAERAHRILASIAPDRSAVARKAGGADRVDDAPVADGSRRVAVPGPRRTALARPVDADAPVADADELARLFTRLLEDPRPATDLVRAVEAVRRLRGQKPAAAAALVRRATTRAQEFDEWRAAAPGPFIADLVLAWLGAAAPSEWGPEPTVRPRYRGPRMSLLLPAGTPMPQGFIVQSASRLGQTAQSGQLGEHVEADDLGVTRIVWAWRPSPSPLTLLASWLEESAALARHPGADDATPLDDYVRAVHATTPPARWRRGIVVPEPEPWVHPHDRLTEPVLHWFDEAAAPGSPADLSEILLEHRCRVDDARFIPRFDAVVEWWAWLFAGSIDHLAAQLHPVLLDAIEATSARGTAAVIAAIGATDRPLGPPACSALALGLSDKTAAGRARAAEAIAALADAGLLDPAALAEQLALCLEERGIQAARVAGALADAASISAIAGWRVLEVLISLLPVCAHANGGVRLVEIAATLAQRYGVAPPMPAALMAKSRGSSAMAVAVRALQGCEPGETPLALAAAEQAAAALTAP